MVNYKAIPILTIFLFIFLLSPVYAFTEYFPVTETDFVVWEAGYTTIGVCPFYDPYCWFSDPTNITTEQRIMNYSTSNDNKLFNFTHNTSIDLDTIEASYLTFRVSSLADEFVSSNLGYLINEGYWSGNNFIPVSGNQELIVYISYLISGTDKVYTVDTRAYASTDPSNMETIMSDNTLNTTNETIHSKLLYIPAQPTDYNFTLFIGFRSEDFVDAEDNLFSIRLLNMTIFTFDKVETLPALFTTAYGVESCNSSASATATRTLGDIYPAGSMGVVKIQHYDTGTPQGVDCIVYQMNNTVVTRRLLNYHFEANDRLHYNSRDFGIVGVGQASVCKDCLVLTKVLNGIVEVTCLDEGTRGSTISPSLNYSSSGVAIIPLIWADCVAEASGYKYQHLQSSLVGDQFNYHLFGNIDSLDFDTYSFSCVQEYSCVGNSVYNLDQNCESNLVQDCGVFGCSDGVCDFPEDVNGTILEVGDHCIDDYQYINVALLTGESLHTCVYPETCRQITPTTVLCLTDAEFIDYLESTEPTSFIAGLLRDTLGLDDLDQGKNIFAILIVIIVSIGVAIKLDKNHAFQVFAITGLVLFLAFWSIGWIPSSQAIIVVFGVAVLLAGALSNKVAGGG